MAIRPEIDGSGGGGGGGRTTFNAGTFADLAALNVWGAANLTSLFNSTAQVTLATVGEQVLEWTGEDTPASYPSGGSWTLREGDLTTTERAAIDSVVNLSAGTIPVATASGLADSELEQEADGTLQTDSRLVVGVGSIDFGPAHRASSNGENVNFANLGSGINYHPLWQTYDAGEDIGTVRVRAGNPADSGNPFLLPVQTVDNGAISDPEWTAVVPQLGTEQGQTMLRSRVFVDASSTMTNAFLDIEIGDTLFYRGPVPGMGAGEVVMDFDPPFDFLVGQSLTFRIRSEDGPIVLRGETTSGFPRVDVYVQIWNDERVAKFSDIVQADWTETDTAALSFIQNKPALATVATSGSYNDLSDRPTIPVARTDEEIRDVVGATLVAGSNVTIAVDDNANTITISSTGGGGGTNPPADADRIYYGLASSSDTTAIDVTTLTRENDPTDPDTISSGVATQGQYFVLFVPMTHDITTITDTVLSQDVTDLFTALDNAQVVDTIAFKSYIIGPLNAGFDESYEVAF